MKKIIKWVLIGVVALFVLAILLLFVVIKFSTPPDNSDSTFKAKVAKAHQNIEISDYHERPIILPGLKAPIGLEISFLLKQKTRDYQWIFMRVPTYDINQEVYNNYDQWIGSIKYPQTLNPNQGAPSVQLQCEGIGDDPGMEIYTPGNYNINNKTRTNVRFLCTPWNILVDDKNAPKVCLGAGALTLPETEADKLDHTHILLSIAEKPSDWWRHIIFSDVPTRAVFISDLLTAQMGKDAKLQDAKFWLESIKTVIQPTLMQNAGYVNCPLPEEKEYNTPYQLTQCWCKK